MARKSNPGKRLYVLDTSVLMHDPTALFRFQEHDVVLPAAVLEELDSAKKGVSEVARNVRQVSRFLDELLQDADLADIQRGLPLNRNSERQAMGRLSFDLQPNAGHGDSAILASAQQLQQSRPDVQVVLVTKDINLRIRALVLGIRAEDYYSDQVLDDADLLHTGIGELTPEVWATAQEELYEQRVSYRLPLPAGDWYVNQCVFVEESSFEGIIRRIDDGVARIEPLIDYRRPDAAAWGIHARNREQNFALNLLLDPNIDFVTLLGPAGTGKTLLTLAAGLVQTLDKQRFGEIIMTRVTVPLGEDIGYLPGTEEEKMTPWMGALMDNLEVLTQTDTGGGWARAATQDVLHSRIKVRSLSFMRGRTFLNKYLILDEAQNLTAKQMKALVTRAGPGTKIVCLGNIAQIDTPYLTETSSGLTYVVERFKNWPHGSHITLSRGERSRLADYATEVL
ncbi:MAG TPA: PhoH family protein [Gammaproteobacteria bacterium]|nr:PhoH family protein [Gammaproteobacteria bacterium]